MIVVLGLELHLRLMKAPLYATVLFEMQQNISMSA